MDRVHYKAGETILTEGEDGRTAFLIVEGSVEVAIGAGARAKIVGTLEAGDVFGEMSLLEPGPRSASVTALADTECVVTTYEEFMATIKSNPDQAIAFMRTLVRRLRQMNEMMAAMDPQRRGLRELFRDWQKSLGGELTEEERDAHYQEMMDRWPVAF